VSGVHPPLSGAPDPGSRRHGTGHFLVQRVTAVVLLFLAFTYIVLLVTLPGADYETIHNYIANPLLAISLLVFVLAGVWHMGVGMQVVIEDYVQSKRAKLIALTLNALFCIAIAIGCVWAVLKIGLAL